MDLLSKLRTEGIVAIPPVCGTATIDGIRQFWGETSLFLRPFFDLENEHILFVLDSTSKGKWPPEEGGLWPGYKQRTQDGNLQWKTTKVRRLDQGDIYTIELQGPKKTYEQIFFPSNSLLGQCRGIFAEYETAASRIINGLFPGHKATFTTLTYVSGGRFIPRHNDGQENFDTLRIVQTISNTRDHTIFVNDKPYKFGDYESYLFNAFFPHEVKESKGARLTLNSCLLPK